MQEHILDNPVFNALSTLQAHLSIGDHLAKRYQPEIGPLTGLKDQSAAAYQSLAQFLAPNEPAVLVLQSDPTPPPNWQILKQKAIIHMLCQATIADLTPLAQCPAQPLTAADVPQMLELTALTNPGPFFRRTIELGDFIGIRENGRLLAMAGQRIAVPGFREVSAVCTHPDARGRGYAKALVAAIALKIRNQNETPFLTSYEDNYNAIRVYQSVGFALRRTLQLAIVLAPAS